MTTVELFVAVVVLVTTVFFAVSAFSPKHLRARSRVDLAGGLADSAVVLVLARLLLPWSTLGPVVWFLPVLLVAAGAVGMVLRWRKLPVWRPDRPRWQGVFLLVVRAVLVLAVAVLLLWPQ